MSPAPGTRIGTYTITDKLGEGGMGEVYRATDSRLKRDVAIKVLPEAFTEDPDRLARFEREAQVLAQLHHPNIASIFGLEESGGIRALVMELVEGPTLAERMAAGRMAIDETLVIVAQIAEALEEAHAKGIVHRDLKPANVKLTPDGRVKVLDFGLAKALDPATETSGAQQSTPMNSPTLTAAMGTQLGVILGTASYMAPEQARGVPIDGDVSQEDASLDLYGFNLDPKIEPVVLASGPGNQYEAAASPDGLAMTYMTEENGSTEAYLVALSLADDRLAAGSDRQRIPIDRVASLSWSIDGGELYAMTTDGDLFAVPLRREGGRVRVDTPTRLFSTTIASTDFSAGPDRDRFLILVDPDAEYQTLGVLLNWRARLESSSDE